MTMSNTMSNNTNSATNKKLKYTPTEIYNNLSKNPELTYGDILFFSLLLDNAGSYFSPKSGKVEHVFQDTQTGFYRKFGLSKPTVFRAFKKLTQLGYIKQKGLYIMLYPEGREVEPTDDGFDDFFDGVSGNRTELKGTPSPELKNEPIDFVF